MNHTEFSEKAKGILNTKLPNDTIGSILYTSFETVTPGDFYIIGLNPGGSPGKVDDRYPLYADMTIEKSLESCKEIDYNEYEKEWIKGRGLLPLQYNVKHISEKILKTTTSKVCCTNLIFKVTKGDKELHPQFWQLADLCWNVHKVLLDIIQPRLIVAFGNQDIVSSYYYLRKKAGFPVQIEKPADHWKYRIKYFNGLIEGRETHVLGLPHLSRYCVHNGTKDDIINGLVSGILTEIHKEKLNS